MLEITCPSCNRKLGMPESAIGKQVRCPACNSVFQVAGPSAAAPPPPAAVQPPRAPQPAPPPYAAPSPPPPQYEYDRGGAQGAYGRSPTEDFDFEEGRGGMEGVRRRTVAGAAANGLMLAGILNIVVVVFMLLNSFFGLGMGVGAFGGFGRHDETALLAAVMMGLVCLLVLFGTPTVFIMIGSNCLRQLRGRGLVITGCVFAFIVGALLILATIGALINFFQALRVGWPMFILFSFLGMVIYGAAAGANISGGVRALVALNNPRVRDAYR